MLTELLDVFPQKKWNWYSVSRNPNLTLHYVVNHPNLPWDWAHILNVYNVCKNEIYNNNKVLWYEFHENFNKLKYIDNMDFPWVNEMEASHPDVNIYTSYEWNGISKNPNITMEFILQNIDKINFAALSQNLFSKHPYVQKINGKKYFEQILIPDIVPILYEYIYT